MPKLTGEASKLTFSELLAIEANKDRLNLVFATLEAFKDGDAGAQKIVMQALQDAMFTEEVKFPITDKRFKEIILLAAERITDPQLIPTAPSLSPSSTTPFDANPQSTPFDTSFANTQNKTSPIPSGDENVPPAF